MKKIFCFVAFIMTTICYSQDLLMQKGTFTRCAPDKFYDSGGNFANYGNDENLVTTICPQNAGEFIILNFTFFTTQLGLQPDIMNIYDGEDTSATLLGTFSGTNSPDMISASDTNTSGCLAVDFTGSATFLVYGANATYNWNFGDGNTATGTNFSTTKYNGIGHCF